MSASNEQQLFIICKRPNNSAPGLFFHAAAVDFSVPGHITFMPSTMAFIKRTPTKYGEWNTRKKKIENTQLWSGRSIQNSSMNQFSEQWIWIAVCLCIMETQRDGTSEKLNTNRVLCGTVNANDGISLTAESAGKKYLFWIMYYCRWNCPSRARTHTQTVSHPQFWLLSLLFLVFCFFVFFVACSRVVLSDSFYIEAWFHAECARVFDWERKRWAREDCALHWIIKNLSICGG